ncbi:MAG: polysaccharide deacetylase family protein [Nanoarchaeota archaeon]
MERREFLKNGLVASVLATQILSPSKASLIEIKYISPEQIEIDKRIVVYLTIDDGPGHYMKEILTKLDENGGKATFFIVGQHYKENPNGHSLLVEAIQKNHLIGNHSYSHPNFHKLGMESAKSEILKTDEIIEQVYNDSGIKRNQERKYFRFPGGATKNSILPFLRDLGYKPIKSWDEQKEDDWNVDTLDWQYGHGMSGEAIMKICKRAKDKDVVLIHDTPAPKNFTFNNIIPYYLDKEKYQLILPS